MNDALGSITIDRCGNMLEVEARSPGMATGLSVLVSAEQLASLMVAAEQLEPMIQFRRREQRESASHGAHRRQA